MEENEAFIVENGSVAGATGTFDLEQTAIQLNAGQPIVGYVISLLLNYIG
jgi:hypothetical protein